jgi:hypothetical protein
MDLTPSDWIAITLVGAGAIVSTFAKRIIRIIGLAIVGIGLVGFIYARIYLDVGHREPSDSAGSINGNSGIVTQGQVGNNSIGK